MAFRVSNIYKSLVRQMQEDLARGRAEASPDLEYISWDERNDESELPSSDLIGLAGWTFLENQGFWEIHCGITISTVNDDNLFREVELIDLLHETWGEKCVIPLYDADGNEYSQLVCEHFEVLAAGQSEKRNYRPLGMTLRRTSSG